MRSQRSECGLYIYITDWSLKFCSNSGEWSPFQARSTVFKAKCSRWMLCCDFSWFGNFTERGSFQVIKNGASFSCQFSSRSNDTSRPCSCQHEERDLDRYPNTLWYPMIPYDTLWYPMLPYDTLCYPMIPYDTLWYPMRVACISNLFDPCSLICWTS